jgi:DNA modification methylase
MSEITLYNDDCINVLKNIKEKTIDLICTDIPYELENHGGTNSEFAKRCARMRDSVDFMAYGIDYDSVFSEFIRVCKIPNMVIFCSNLQVGKIISFFSEKGLKTDVLVWEKSNPAPMCNGKYMSDLEYIIYVHDKGSPFNNDAPFEFKKKCKIYPIVVSNDKVHPTQKPLDLLEWLIKTYTNEGELVLDNCMGSGTTGVACKNLNRNFIGIEKEETYFNIAKERIENG